uniref:Cathepsin propeptide inhibitor domain-containing protein n=1 Tax=Oryza barthii TaxID=65489 RepID=A0A0D3HTB2_9ORYZ
MAAAARHVASYMGRFAPRCGYAGNTTCTAAAWTRPQLPHAPSGPLVILRRGIAMIPGDHSPGPADISPDCFDPEAPARQVHPQAHSDIVVSQDRALLGNHRAAEPRRIKLVDARRVPGVATRVRGAGRDVPHHDPATCFAYDEKDLESEEAVWALYQRWCSFHDIERDRDDMVRRFVYFKDRAHKIIEFNKSGKSNTWGLNIFGDMTPEEQSELERPQLLRSREGFEAQNHPF